MSKFDYILGALLFFFGAFLLTGPAIHWSALLLYCCALAMFVLFVVRHKRERCNQCGHYFQRSVFERLMERGRRRMRCEDCRVLSVRTSSSDSEITA